jgi:hypothetical protein
LHRALSEETTTTMTTDEENTNQNTMTTAKRIMILRSISTMKMELGEHYAAVAVHPNLLTKKRTTTTTWEEGRRF